MRVRVAYISSFGTAAILVAAALTLLTVVGTIVAFRGWPDGATGSGVQTVPLAPGVSPAPAAVVRRTPTALHGEVHRAPARHHAAARPSTAGLVKTTAAAPGAVSGLVMVPVNAAPPMVSHSTSPAQVPPSAQPGAEPTAYLPADPQGPGPVPSTGDGLPLPSLGLSSPPPPDQLAAMANQLLSEGPPPPPLQVAGVERRLR